MKLTNTEYEILKKQAYDKAVERTPKGDMIGYGSCVFVNRWLQILADLVAEAVSNKK